MKQDIKSLSREELQDAFAELGLPKYRAKQVFVWLHRGVTDFREMTDLPKQLQ